MLNLKNATFIFLIHIIIFFIMNEFYATMDYLIVDIIIVASFFFITLPLFILSFIKFFITE